MDGSGTPAFWDYILPQWNDMFSGGIQAVTPWLVAIILAIAAGTIVFISLKAHGARRKVEAFKIITEGLEPGDFLTHRQSIRERAGGLKEPLNRIWREYDESLVVDRQEVFSTVRAAEFFNSDIFAPRLIGNRLIHVVPTALTTLGLLGTFVGLTVGLRGLDLGSTSEELRTNIQHLVNGAALGFTASLWGVAASIIVNLIDRFIERHVVKQIAALQYQIDRLCPPRSLEHILADIAESSLESKEALQVLHEKIGSALQEAVAHVGESTSQAVSTAINDSLSPVMTDLASRAATQSAEVFEQVARQLTESFNQIGVSLASELRESASSMRSTLEYMGEQLAEHSDRHLGILEAHRTAVTEQMEQVATVTAQHISLVNDTLPPLVQALHDSGTLIGSSSESMKSAAQELVSVSDRLSATSETIGDRLASTSQTVTEVANTLAVASSVASDQTRAAATLTQEASEAATALSAASTSMTANFDNMKHAQRSFLDELEISLGVHSKEMAAWLSSYADQVSNQSTRRMDEWNRQTDAFTTRMIAATEAMSQAIDELDFKNNAVKGSK